MATLIRLLTFLLIGVFLTSCSFFQAAQANDVQATPDLSSIVTIELTVQADTSVPFNTVGQNIQYAYTVKNIGFTPVPGPVTIAGATCPEVTTIGNLDNIFDTNEILICTSTHVITQADLDLGMVTNVSTASVGGINSNQVVTTVATVAPEILKLTKTANPTTYDRVGQLITYNYVITNSGTATLGPAQFSISDTGISTPINCGNSDTTLASNATVTCSATYTVTQADMDATSIATNATASGSGVAPSKPVSATVTKSAAQNPSNLTAGTTITHQVVAGEWLWQIARCYGADPKRVSEANPPTPGEISPNTTVTVPNIGSAGRIYGPPCVGTHTVQSGDTWASIAQRYNADVVVLQMVNENSLAVGTVLKVPLNSAGAVTTLPVTPIPTTGATTQCVDLTRTITLTGTNSGLTHFNVCGTMDSTGKMKIATIKVSQLAAEVPATNLISQDITFSVETSTLINDANSLIVGDVNYDGNSDFRIVEFLPAGANIPYLYYLYDPATNRFVYSEAYRKITSPEFPGNNEIRSQWRESATKWGIDTYTISDNAPRLIKRETWEAINATQARHIVTTFNADGTSQVTVDETIPLPTP